MISSYDMLRLCLLSLILFKPDISAFLSRPLWSQLSSGYSDVANTNRKLFIAWSVSNGPTRSIVDDSRQIQEINVERKSERKNKNYSKSSNSLGGSGASTGLWESTLRNAIVYKKWQDASKMLMTLNSTKLSSGRDVVYVITETSRRSQNLSAIIPLLSSLVKLERNYDFTTEDDIMPLLFDCSQTNRIPIGYRIVSWLYTRNVKFSAKTYSVLLKGYGLQKNEQMIDRILMECVKYSVKPDIVLFNGAIDAYIRCGNPQKSIDLFDAVMSAEDEEINNDKNRYSNKDRNEIQRLSKTFTNHGLKPNIRTYNTVLKALRGHKSFEKCLGVVQSMRKNEIQPDSVTVNTLVDAAVITGNLEIAEDLIKHPMATPGVEAYTALISGYSSEGNVTEAFRMLNLMISKEVLPNSFTLTALMKTCVTKGDWESARELLCIGSNYWNSTSVAATRYPTKALHMRLTSSANPYLTSKELAVLHGSYVIGLCSLAVSSEDFSDRELYLKEAQFELITMEEMKLKPDTATMNAFIQALCAMQPARVTDALLILRAMKIENIEPDDYTYSILFTSLGKEGYIDEALQLFRNTEKHMDTPALNALLRAFIGGPNPMQALKIYQEMISANNSITDTGKFAPSKYTFTILFLAISRSISPQKFMPSPVDKMEGTMYSDINGMKKKLKFSTKPQRYLTGFKGNSQSQKNVNVNMNTNGTDTNDENNIFIDTTMKNLNTPLQALSVLGEVVKSIGVKLNTKMNGPNTQTSYEIRGVHGNYVSNPYSDISDKIEKEKEAALFEERKRSQPLFYDNDTGRFYEQTFSEMSYLEETSTSKTSRTANLPSLPTKKQSYTTEDLFETKVEKDIYDKYGPPDNLDLMRLKYAKEQEAKIKSMNEAKAAAEAAKANKMLSDEDISEGYDEKTEYLDFVNMNPDTLLQKLFLSMRFDYNIEADEIMISALNSLFTTTNNFQSPSQPQLLPSEKEKNLKGKAIGENQSNEYSNYKPNTPPSVSLGWAKKQVLSKKTAELIFADLVISGWHPSLFQPILYSCGYPQRQVTELLREEEDNSAIKKIRASAASIRIFKKHDWNNVESGWSVFFQ